MQIWLYGNSRSALLPGLGSFGLCVLGGLAVWLLRDSPWQWAAALLIFGMAAALGLSSLLLMRAARIALDGSDVLLYIRSGSPQRIPIDCVEAFFLGQGEGAAGERRGPAIETTNVVVRLAERAHQFQHGSTSPILAHWCNGYITIYGTWCQRLNAQVIGELNHKLVEAKRRLKSNSAAGEAP